MLDLHGRMLLRLTYWAARKSKFPFGSTWSNWALFDKAKYRKMMTLRHDCVPINSAAFITGAQTNGVKLYEVKRARKKGKLFHLVYNSEGNSGLTTFSKTLWTEAAVAIQQRHGEENKKYFKLQCNKYSKANDKNPTVIYRYMIKYHCEVSLY